MVVMTYNGTDLSELITIQEVLRNVGNERVVSTNDAPNLGVNVTGLKTSAKTITVSFYMKNKFNKYALNQDKHKLAGIFNVDKPVKITFDDEPDKYYMGYTQGIAEIEDPIAWLSVLSIELLIPDGVAHSTTYREFTDATFVDEEADINTGTNILSGGDGKFKPHRTEEYDTFDNFEYFLGASVYLEKGKKYVFGGKTDGEFSNLHNTSVESDRVVVWVAQYNSVNSTTKNHQIISSSDASGVGTGFKHTKETGNYIIRVNSYHRLDSLVRSVWDLRIVEAGENINKLVVPIVNNGTVDALPIITLNTNSDNGYYGLVNETGIFQAGDSEEEDAYIKEDQVFRAQYMPNGYTLVNKMVGGNNNFRPNSNPTENYENSKIYTNAKVYLENGERYILKAETDGIFTDTNAPNIESDNVLISLVDNESEAISVIVSNSTTATTGTPFDWAQQTGWYCLKVTTYHKEAIKYVSNVKITGNIENNNILDQAYKDSFKNEAVLNDTPQSLTWGGIEAIDFWGRRHLGQVVPEVYNTPYAVSSMSFNIEPTLSEYIWWRNIFEVASENEYGMFKVTFSDEDNNFLYGVEVIKRNKGLAATYNLLGRDSNGGVVIVEGFNFALNLNNPLDENHGFCDITRDNDTIKLYTFGAYKTYTWEQIKDIKTTKVHFTWYAFNGKKPVTRNYLDSFLIIDKKGTILEEAPNRYFAGSELIVNSEDDSIQQNGIYNISQKTIGATFVKIPPGESELEVYVSSWSLDIPDISVKFEERYL